MQAFLDANTGTLLAVSFILSIIALVAVLVMLREVRRLRQPFGTMADLYEKSGPEAALAELLKGVDENRGFIQGQSEEIKRIYGMLDRDFSNLGLVKYNAFEDIGGNQSYSLCLLSRQKNGVILTNLVGRNSTRGYALEVTAGVPARKLSDEEQEALNAAITSVESGI